MTWESQLPVLRRDSPFDAQIHPLHDEALLGGSDPISKREPGCNVHEDGQTFSVQMALPGIEVKDIDVRVEKQCAFRERRKGDRRGEGDETRAWYVHELKEGVVASSFPLPSSVDDQKASVSYKQGAADDHVPKT